MTSWFRGSVLYTIVLVIGLLIIGDVFLIYQNNSVITFNKNQQEQAEKVKVSASDVIRSIHLLDLAVRSYAFVYNEHFKAAMDTAIRDKNNSLSRLENSLKAQGYPMDGFYDLRDSIEAYVKTTELMVDLVDKKDQQAFVKILEIDPGYRVWAQFQNFSKEVYAFEDKVSANAQLRYDAALKNTYVLQIILFFIAIPTLAYTAYWANRTMSISEQLRKSEEEKATILAQQNRLLEETVQERTREILLQNEEITAQNEEIGMHNEKLLEAKNVIERQNELIQQKNDELATEVTRQTQSLTQVNAELLEHNSRLEQFAFIISHNLRAPMSRVIGLSSILDFTKDANEISDIAKLMTKSTQDMDHILRDLTEILNIQKLNAGAMNKVHLETLLSKVIETLQDDIKASDANISADFSQASQLLTISGYLESILYNLICNAIKYRHPRRKPMIKIQSKTEGQFVKIEVTDNGLGIDLETHKENLFSLYKRFHFHVEGRGLGLYLVKTQVTALGGKIELESKEGDGTTFRVWLKDFDTQSS